jgi:hypothetical protein
MPLKIGLLHPNILSLAWSFGIIRRYPNYLQAVYIDVLAELDKVIVQALLCVR